MIQIAALWASADPKEWEDALAHYWSFVQPQNLALEQSLDTLDLERLRRLDARGWYEFLRDEYFRWKYIQPEIDMPPRPSIYDATLTTVPSVISIRFEDAS
jgi:hypothetical protein